MMKLTKILLLSGAFVLISQIPFMVVQAEKRVKCDDQQQACRDQHGWSIRLTRDRYGDRAADRLQRRLSKGKANGHRTSPPDKRQQQPSKNDDHGHRTSPPDKRQQQLSKNDDRGHRTSPPDKRQQQPSKNDDRGHRTSPPDKRQQQPVPQPPNKQPHRPPVDSRRTQEVFTPISGVRCVRSERVCYHHSQPSRYFTSIYFDVGAANRLEQRLDPR